jgi:4-hydroxy-tetrahydrodipicolinate synthase
MTETTSRSAHRGIWPALLTPLTEKQAVDVPALVAHIRWLFAQGCAGATLFGTTGEGPSFSLAERKAALDALIEAGVPANRLLVHTSCAALPETIELIRHATAHGVHGCLLMPPFFFKGVSDAGVVAAYRQIFEAVADPALRVVLYNIPQISGVPVTRAVIEPLLADYSAQILGIKDSGCVREASLALHEAFPDLQVWVGNEPDLQVMAGLGSLGAVSGVANVLPKLVQRLVGSAPSDDPAADMARVQSFLSVFAEFPMLPAFKAMQAQRAGAAGWRRMRAPLVELDDAQVAALAERLAELGFDFSRDDEV